MLDILKDYLISITADIDKNAFSEVDKTISKTEKNLGKFSQTAVGKFAIAGAALTSFYGAVTGATMKLANSVAKADRNIEMMAKRLYTTEKNARSLSLVMKTMGVGSLDELQDVALNPEMRSQFNQLRSLSRSLDDGSYKKALRDIRAINFEFQKFAIRFEYFKMNVVANFMEALKPTLNALKKDLKPFLDNLIKNAPKYAKTIGEFLARIVQIAINVTRAFAKLFKWIYGLPDIIKKVGIAATGLALVLRSKFGAVVLALQTLFLIIDDFMVYQQGGLSQYSDFWDFVTGKTNGLNLDMDNLLGGSLLAELVDFVKDIRYYVEELAKHFNVKTIVKTAVNTATSSIVHGTNAVEKIANSVMDKIPAVSKPSWYKGAGKLTTLSGDVGNLRFIGAKQVSEPLKKFLTGLNNVMDEKVWDRGHEAQITSATEFRKRGGLHPKGEAFDVTFGWGNSISKNFDYTMKYLRNLYQVEGFKRALIETDSQEFVNKVKNQLHKEGYDTSKVVGMSLKQAGATGENIHTEIDANNKDLGNYHQVSINNNFYGYDTERIYTALQEQSYNTINEGVSLA